MKSKGKLNVLLVAIDTLRKDHVGCYGYHKPTSPNIDKIASKGAIFTNDYASDAPTQPSYASVLTGQRGITTGMVSHESSEILSDGSPFISEILARNGYVTASVSSLFYMKRHFARGFSYFMNPSATGSFRVQLVTADEINSYAVPWVRQHLKDNFFLFIHYWDVHWPYWPPESYRTLFYHGEKSDPDDVTVLRRTHGQPHRMNPAFKEARNRAAKDGLLKDRRPIPGPYKKNMDYVTGLYDGEIKYVDDKMGEIVTALEEGDIAEKTLIIIFADHGELESRNHTEVYDPIVNVPLIFCCPAAISSGKKIGALVQNIDIVPTIFDMIGLKEKKGEPAPLLDGRSLLPLLEGETNEGYDAIFSNIGYLQVARTIRTERWKYIENMYNALYLKPPQELYDLKKDPFERHNIAEEEKDQTKKMRTNLNDWLSSKLESQPDPLRLLAEKRLQRACRALQTQDPRDLIFALSASGA